MDITGPFEFSLGIKEELHEEELEELQEMGIDLEQWGIGK